MDDALNCKVPSRGGIALVFDETCSDAAYDTYRRRALASGGRLFRVRSIEAVQRHLAVYIPDVIVHLKEPSE